MSFSRGTLANIAVLIDKYYDRSWLNTQAESKNAFDRLLAIADSELHSISGALIPWSEQELIAQACRAVANLYNNPQQFDSGNYPEKNNDKNIFYLVKNAYIASIDEKSWAEVTTKNILISLNGTRREKLITDIATSGDQSIYFLRDKLNQSLFFIEKFCAQASFDEKQKMIQLFFTKLISRTKLVIENRSKKQWPEHYFKFVIDLINNITQQTPTFISLTTAASITSQLANMVGCEQNTLIEKNIFNIYSKLIKVSSPEKTETIINHAVETAANLIKNNGADALHIMPYIKTFAFSDQPIISAQIMYIDWVREGFAGPHVNTEELLKVIEDILLHLKKLSNEDKEKLLSVLQWIPIAATSSAAHLLPASAPDAKPSAPSSSGGNLPFMEENEEIDPLDRINILSYLLQARIYLDLASPHDAIKNLLNTIRLDENNIEARYYLGLAYLKLKTPDYTQAINAFNALINIIAYQHNHVLEKKYEKIIHGIKDSISSIKQNNNLSNEEQTIILNIEEKQEAIGFINGYIPAKTLKFYSLEIDNEQYKLTSSYINEQLFTLDIKQSIPLTNQLIAEKVDDAYLLQAKLYLEAFTKSFSSATNNQDKLAAEKLLEKANVTLKNIIDLLEKDKISIPNSEIINTFNSCIGGLSRIPKNYPTDFEVYYAFAQTVEQAARLLNQSDLKKGAIDLYQEGKIVNHIKSNNRLFELSNNPSNKYERLPYLASLLSLIEAKSFENNFNITRSAFESLSTSEVNAEKNLFWKHLPLLYWQALQFDENYFSQLFENQFKKQFDIGTKKITSQYLFDNIQQLIDQDKSDLSIHYLTILGNHAISHALIKKIEFFMAKADFLSAMQEISLIIDILKNNNGLQVDQPDFTQEELISIFNQISFLNQQTSTDSEFNYQLGQLLETCVENKGKLKKIYDTCFHYGQEKEQQEPWENDQANNRIIELYARALKEYPHYSNAAIALSRVYQKENNVVQAVNVLETSGESIFSTLRVEVIAAHENEKMNTYDQPLSDFLKDNQIIAIKLNTLEKINHELRSIKIDERNPEKEESQNKDAELKPNEVANSFEKRTAILLASHYQHIPRELPEPEKEKYLQAMQYIIQDLKDKQKPETYINREITNYAYAKSGVLYFAVEYIQPYLPSIENRNKTHAGKNISLHHLHILIQLLIDCYQSENLYKGNSEEKANQLIDTIFTMLKNREMPDHQLISLKDCFVDLINLKLLINHKNNRRENNEKDIYPIINELFNYHIDITSHTVRDQQNTSKIGFNIPGEESNKPTTITHFSDLASFWKAINAPPESSLFKKLEAKKELNRKYLNYLTAKKYEITEASITFLKDTVTSNKEDAAFAAYCLGNIYTVDLHNMLRQPSLSDAENYFKKAVLGGEEAALTKLAVYYEKNKVDFLLILFQAVLNHPENVTILYYLKDYLENNFNANKSNANEPNNDTETPIGPPPKNQHKIGLTTLVIGKATGFLSRFSRFSNLAPDALKNEIYIAALTNNEENLKAIYKNNSLVYTTALKSFSDRREAFAATKSLFSDWLSELITTLYSAASKAKDEMASKIPTSKKITEKKQEALPSKKEKSDTAKEKSNANSNSNSDESESEINAKIAARLNEYNEAKMRNQKNVIFPRSGPKFESPNAKKVKEEETVKASKKGSSF